MIEKFNLEKKQGALVLEVIPAKDALRTKNCILIKKDQIPTTLEIIKLAHDNEAIIKGHGQDDLYAVQFEGEEQDLLSESQIDEKIEVLMNRYEDQVVA